MTNLSTRIRRAAVAAVMTIQVLGLTQVASAADRCNDRGRYRDSGYRESYGRYRDSYDSGRYGAYDRYQNNSAYRDSYYNNNGYYGDLYGSYPQTRSAGHSAAIIGGSAAAGAAVGGLSGGKKGAIIGAAVGAAGGLIYDRTTRNNGRTW